MKTLEDLKEAYDGSYYFIAGCGGDLQEWVDGYNSLLKENEIGEPVQWYVTSGAAVNMFATERNGLIVSSDRFQNDLTCLLFPLDGLSVGVLALFKLQMQDRWFDDVIDNMRSAQ